jgi:hypothetical protein
VALTEIARTDWPGRYSTASYLRLNGILPSTAQPKKYSIRIDCQVGS